MTEPTGVCTKSYEAAADQRFWDTRPHFQCRIPATSRDEQREGVPD